MTRRIDSGHGLSDTPASLRAMHDGNPPPVFWGIRSHELREVFNFAATRAKAEAVLAEILADEPAWHADLEVVRVEFGAAVEVSPARIERPA